MNKFLNIAALSVIGLSALTACSPSDPDDIYPEGPNQRLTNTIESYTQLLTSEGGKWAVDYFANTDEPGYVYLMTFKDDGTVTMSGYNKWIGKLQPGNTFRNIPTFGTETSMWEIIGDNGPVLSFNTYNSIFHLFSTPDAYPGDQDPSTLGDGSSGYYNEGEGHNGDYEFDLMRTSNDTIYMLGKKHELSIIMHRVPADTDDEAYFEQINSMLATTNITKFPDLILRGADGENYVVNDIATQVVTFYPQASDWRDRVAQTVSGNAIATLNGFRFVEPVELINSKDGKTLTVQHFELQTDGSFLCTDDGVSRITCLPYTELFNSSDYVWTSDRTDLGGRFQTLLDEIVEGLKGLSARNRPNWVDMVFMYDDVDKTMVMRIAGHKVENDRVGQADFFVDAPTINSDVQFKLNFNGGHDNTATTYLNRAPALQTLIDYMGSTTFTISSPSAVNPSRLKVTSDSDPNDYFWVDVR